MQNHINPIFVFLSAFTVASFAGLAALLRAGKEVTTVGVISAILNSGMLGLAIALVWYHKFQDNVYFLVGICVLAGLGGATMVDFILQVFKSYISSFQPKGGEQRAIKDAGEEFNDKR